MNHHHLAFRINSSFLFLSSFLSSCMGNQIGLLNAAVTTIFNVNVKADIDILPAAQSLGRDLDQTANRCVDGLVTHVKNTVDVAQQRFSMSLLQCVREFDQNNCILLDRFLADVDGNFQQFIQHFDANVAKLSQDISVNRP